MKDSDFKPSRKRKRSVIISNDNFLVVSLEKTEFPPKKKCPSISSVNESYVVSSSKKKRDPYYEQFIKQLFNDTEKPTSDVELGESQNEDFGAVSGSTPKYPTSVELSSEEPSTEESSGEEAECNEGDNTFTNFLNSFPTLSDSDNEKELPYVIEDNDGSTNLQMCKAREQEIKSEEIDYQSSHESEMADDYQASNESEMADDYQASHESEMADDYQTSHESEMADDYQAFHKKEMPVEETDNKEEKKEKKAKYGKNRILKLSDNVCVVRIPSRSTEVLLLTHPASVSLLKHISVRVLNGGISIFGYSMDSQSSPVKLFSSQKTGVISLNTEYSEPIWKKRDLYKSVKKNLQAISSTDTAMEILAMCVNSTVIVVLESCIYPPPIQFLKLYFSHVFHFKKKPQRNPDRAFCELNGHGSIRFSKFCDSLAEKIKDTIRRATIKDEPGPRIVVLGPKKCGKSSLVRFLINKALHMFQEVFYLESDPGQTEFTPPGVVSLTKVTKPLLGPPFMHLKKPKKMIFTGSITPETSPDMYNKSICQLMEHYNSSYSSEPLFVNTMGWITGMGAECLQNLIKAVEPTILINLIQVKRPRFNCRQFLKKNVKYVEINIAKPHENVGGFTAFEMRHLAMLAYLGRCQSPFLRPLYLNEMQPYCVCWDKVAVYVFNRRLPPYRLLEALNGSIVALCNVDESLILESDIPGYQKTLTDEPDNDCLGFGVVRAIDEANHLLFIVTPLPLKELQNVNAIMKGNILLPKEVLLQQPIDYTAIPFTDQPTGAPTAFRKRVQKRVRRQQN